MDLTQLVGLFGATLAGVAYLPQIIHLAKEHCSVGISRSAFSLWLIAALAILVHAVSIGSVVFIFLATIQVTANLIIIFFAYKYKDGVCVYHAHLKENN